MSGKEYLGDGLYVYDEGFQIELSAMQANGVNAVYLDDTVLDALFRFIEKKRSVKISITHVPRGTTD